MKASFSVQKISFSFDGELPQKLVDVTEKICDAIDEILPAFKEVATDALREAKAQLAK